MDLLKSIAILMLLSTLAACGGGSSDSSEPEPEVPVEPEVPAEPSPTSLSRSGGGVITISSQVDPNASVTVTFPDGSVQTVKADADGNFTAVSVHSQPDGDTKYTALSASGGSVTAIIPPTVAPTTTSVTANANGSIVIAGTATPNSTVTAVFPDGTSKDVIVNSDGTFTITSNASQPMGEVTLTSVDEGISSAPAFVSATNVEIALYKATGVLPELSFKPSLGINTESPQGGADTAGMPMPFVDIFRTARPFEEFESATGDITVDSNGWPTKLDADKKYTKTVLLQGALKDSIPDGVYSLLYSGDAKFEFSTTAGSLKDFNKVTNENKYELHIALNDIQPRKINETIRDYEARVSSTNQFGFNLKSTDAGVDLDIKDIRIVMSGGTCSDNPFLRVYSDDDCPNKNYESFESRLEENRNAIIFNPDYLAFLRNFKVVRMMNLMEASLKKLCYEPTECPAGIGAWSHRAMLDDAVWGGNDGRTDHEDHKGVPIEVMVELANILKRDIWVNMPHVATDEYVEEYAKFVKAALNPALRVYVEYTNEVWNSGFAAYRYTSAKGLTTEGYDELPTNTAYDYQAKCDSLPYGTDDEIKLKDGSRCEKYFARLRYFSTRSVEIFDLWEAEFGQNSTRLTKVLGSFVGDQLLTDFMVKHIVTTFGTNKVDAIAIAPYFYGCPYRVDEEDKKYCHLAEKTLTEATSVDDIFSIIDQPSKDDAGNYVDVKGLEGTIDAVKRQLDVLKNTGIDLITYEGGQHLVPSVLGDYATDDEKTELQQLFDDANRDPRMKDRYIQFLNAWKDLYSDGATLFTLYTLPQSFYRYGNFGIKEHLNQAREDAPKFDGVMTFQEAVKTCWWDGCNP